MGRHVGDGVVAFFPAELSGSESAAAHACLSAALALTAAVAEVGGRAEVTALGDDVNDAARIEACATGGRTLASKDLIERLAPDDAAELGIEPDRLTYAMLSDLATATDKARRDAPAIAVCDISTPHRVT